MIYHDEYRIFNVLITLKNLEALLNKSKVLNAPLFSYGLTKRQYQYREYYLLQTLALKTFYVVVKT